MNLSSDIKQKALELGFDIVGITTAEQVSVDDASRIRQWLKANQNGGMGYMHRNFEKRIDPSKLLPGAKSVICVGSSYKPTSQEKQLIDKMPVKIANFAMFEDYHHFIKDRLFALAEFIKSETNQKMKFKACVDSVPMLERALAVRAGLGCIGKNRMLINPEVGLQILLGELITNIELVPDKPITGNCSNCDKCIKACPTGALKNDGSFEAEKCISYLTIEKDGKIADSYKQKISNRLFGCDECILACPYNAGSPTRKNTDLKFQNQLTSLTADKIISWDEKQFNQNLSQTALHRTGLTNLKRNAKICLNYFDS